MRNRAVVNSFLMCQHLSMSVVHATPTIKNYSISCSAPVLIPVKSIFQESSESFIDCNEAEQWTKKKNPDIFFVCDECNYSTNRKGNLHRHYFLKHSEFRPHSCLQCHKKFKLKHHLEAHMLVHSPHT